MNTPAPGPEAPAPRRAWWKPFRFPALSPPGFLVLAAFLTILFLSAHLAGWREYATGLTGTPATEEGFSRTAFACGALYVILYLSFVLAVPILILAAPILLGLERLARLCARKPAPPAALLIAAAATLLLGGCGPHRPESASKGTFTLWQLPSQTPAQMTSYVIRTANGKVIVFDGGRKADAPHLRKFLKGLGNRVEAWFISHPHDDHVSAAAELLRDPQGCKIIAFYGSFPDCEWVRNHGTKKDYDLLVLFIHFLSSEGRVLTPVRPGEEMTIDGLRIKILGGFNPDITVNAVNNSSLVMRVWDKRKSVLFLGDLGVEGGDKLLRSPHAADLPSDYVQMAHHGQQGVGEEFYRKVNPKFCLWPAPEWLWDNDRGGAGKGTGPWKTLEVRAWMEKLPIKAHYVSFRGLQKIE